MKEDPNPYTRIRRKSANDLILKRCNEAWDEGDKHGQLHPSPQTIKKIQTNFAEKVKERLRLHIECEYSDNETEDWAFKNGMKWAIRELDQLTQQNQED